MASMRFWRFRLCAVALAACMLAAFFGQSASATPQRWYRWEQNLLDLSEVIGALHYLRRLCGNPRDPLWRERMIDLLDDQGAYGERREMLVSRFNRGHHETRRRHERCSVSARLKTEHLSLIGEDLVVWFSANSPY